MAKKSNKTEHVLKLITKNDESVQDSDFFVINKEISEKDLSTSKSAAQQKEDKLKQIEKIVEQPEEKEPKQNEAASAERYKEEPEPLASREPSNAESAILELNNDLVNIAEILAREKLPLVMEKMKVCTCRTCVNDVLALALNSLPTKYVTTDAGKQYFQLDVYKKQYETDILAALTKACVRVKASPRH